MILFPNNKGLSVEKVQESFAMAVMVLPMLYGYTLLTIVCGVAFLLVILSKE
jgi:hypothetical protein